MSDSEPDDVQINFIASPAQKERWEEHANGAGYRSLSGFLRTAAEKETNRGSMDGGVPTDVTEQLSEVIEGLNRVESRIRDFDTRLATLESEIREDPDIKKLANEVFSVLPTRNQAIEYAKRDTPPDEKVSDGTVEGIAAVLDAEEYRISDAIDKLQEDTHQIGTVVLADEIEGWAEHREGGDSSRYYKEA